MECLRLSKSLVIFPSLSLQFGTSNYLLLRIPIFYKKMFAQVRLFNRHVSRILFDRKKFTFHPNATCTFCYLEEDSLFHISVSCPACDHLFAPIIKNECNNLSSLDKWLNVLSSNNSLVIKKFVNCFVKVLDSRIPYNNA